MIFGHLPSIAPAARARGRRAAAGDRVQRLADAAGLLGAIEHRYRARGFRDCRGKCRAVEGTEQPHLEQTDLLSACQQALDRLVGRAGARAH